MQMRDFREMLNRSELKVALACINPTSISLFVVLFYKKIITIWTQTGLNYSSTLSNSSILHPLCIPFGHTFFYSFLEIVKQFVWTLRSLRCFPAITLKKTSMHYKTDTKIGNLAWCSYIHSDWRGYTKQPVCTAEWETQGASPSFLTSLALWWTTSTVIPYKRFPW